ncbi:endonuclease/exonuclease/phosphatase family protein [Micromonospora sp. NPDC023966]|uniref:endonuclease/exonuclease/phosphatase family protein n=1 Tax=Micromonospora sp. NPDC023966 TaxID=3154699 RepID=UPI0033D7C7E6
MVGTAYFSRRRLVPLATALVLAVAATAPLAAPASAHCKHDIRVLTRNVYIGGDLAPSVAAQTLPEFLGANAALVAHADQMDFPARARLLAAEIRERRPDLVGLQEVALWRTGPIFDPQPATSVRADYLAILLAALAATGQHYRAVVTQDEADLEAPAGDPFQFDVRLTLRDVILVRQGSPVRVTDTARAQFQHNVVVTIPATGTTATLAFAWTAVDAVLDRRSFRFVNTHLEAVNPIVRLQQAQELAEGPLRTLRPVILVGDLNTGPDRTSPDDRLAYLMLLAYGLRDTWPLLHHRDPGYTVDLGVDLNQPADSLEHRVDLILVRGAVKPLRSEVFGTERRTPGGRWASDHLGHAATLAVR